MKYSIIIPVYNERDTILEIIERVDSVDLNKEIIVVDDCSTDGTRTRLKEVENICRVFHGENRGKGSAVRSALERVTGDVVIIQDADFEYNPRDYLKIVKPIENGRASVVFGSRFKGNGEFRMISYIANRILTSLFNLIYGVKLSDMNTCYKCIRTEIIRTLKLEGRRFEIDPEITAKLIKGGYQIIEVPISYSGRRKGKKIGVRDGIESIRTMLKLKLSRKLY